MPDLALVATGLVYGYVRESNDDQMDPEGQMRDCRALAVRYGYDPEEIEWVSDWGQSGRRLDRPGYVRVKADIEAGRVVAVLARSVDRLGRDAQEVMAFEALAIAHGTRVLTDRDGERTIDPDSVNTVVRWLPALLAQEESRLGRDRARRGRTTRLANMEAHIASCPWVGPGTETAMCSTPQAHFDGVAPYGVQPGEDIEAVFATFAMVGSYQGAARRLNAMGVRPRRGTQWESTTVMRVIARGSATGRIALPARARRRHRTYATHTFARLLVCPDDNSVLTATFRTTRAGRDVTYFCRQGRQAVARCPEHGEMLLRRIDWRWDCPAGHVRSRFDVVGDHPRPWSVPEHVVLAWAKAAAAEVMGHTPHLRPDGIVRAADTDEAAIARLQEQRRRIVGAHIRLDIGDQERDTLLTALDAELDVLRGAQRASATWSLGIDWGMPTGDLNARLREVLHSIVLGPDMRPVAGVWMRQPHIDVPGDPDGLSIPNPAAVQVAGGWLVPFTTDDRRLYGRHARSEVAASKGKAAS